MFYDPNFYKLQHFLVAAQEIPSYEAKWQGASPNMLYFGIFWDTLVHLSEREKQPAKVTREPPASCRPALGVWLHMYLHTDHWVHINPRQLPGLNDRHAYLEVLGCQVGVQARRTDKL